MACRLDKIYACVNTGIENVSSVDLVLRIKICIVAMFDVLNDWSPRVFVVDKFTKARSIDNGQPKAYSILLNICADR